MSKPSVNDRLRSENRDLGIFLAAAVHALGGEFEVTSQTEDAIQNSKLVRVGPAKVRLEYPKHS